MWLRHANLSKTASVTFFYRETHPGSEMASQNDQNGMFAKNDQNALCGLRSGGAMKAGRSVVAPPERRVCASASAPAPRTVAADEAPHPGPAIQRFESPWIRLSDGGKGQGVRAGRKHGGIAGACGG